MSIFGLFRTKENMWISVDILTKRKYDLEWQRENIGGPLLGFLKDYFESSAINYGIEKGQFDGFDLFMEDSKFKIDTKSGFEDWKQFQQRYKEFLPAFLEHMIMILVKLKLKFKIVRAQRLENSLKEALTYISTNSLRRGGTMNFFDNKGLLSERIIKNKKV